MALKPVAVGEPFETPAGDLVRIESVIPDADRPLYIGYADSGSEATLDDLATWGFCLAEKVPTAPLSGPDLVQQEVHSGDLL